MGAPRYPSGPRGPVRMPQGIGNEFNGVSPIKTKNHLKFLKHFNKCVIYFFSLIASRTTDDAK